MPKWANFVKTGTIKVRLCSYYGDRYTEDNGTTFWWYARYWWNEAPVSRMPECLQMGSKRIAVATQIATSDAALTVRYRGTHFTVWSGDEFCEAYCLSIHDTCKHNGLGPLWLLFLESKAEDDASYDFRLLMSFKICNGVNSMNMKIWISETRCFWYAGNFNRQTVRIQMIIYSALLITVLVGKVGHQR